MDHKLFIFIDESGDLGKYGSKYFSIVALSTQAVDNLNRIIKRVRQRKLRKKLKEMPELKANNSGDLIRETVLRKVAQLDCSISVVVVPKSLVRDDLFQHKEKLYNYLCGLLFEHITLNVDSVDITIDKKHNNRLLREDFNQYIERKIRSRRASIRVMIQHLESHTSNALQAVDFVAWAMNRKFSFDDPTFYNLIASKIENAGRENPWNRPFQ
ncbi:MAG: DUF3800 domain-containing protein [Candidatus Thermoplasmatota archaeon]|jgi:hypothetical protein|nr:DUF3800 domain-containing protein [Candidatus Thermoplasmatota archaeon]